MKNKNSNLGIVGIATIVTLAMLALAVFSTPAMAQCYCPVSPDCPGSRIGTVTSGEVFLTNTSVEGDYWEFEVPNGTVQWAQIHWYSWDAVFPASATFCNGDGTCQDITFNSECSQTETYGNWVSGMGSFHFYWKVSATPGTNSITLQTDHFDSRWKFFVAVIDNTDDPIHHGKYWVNNGFNKPCSADTWFNGSINNGANHTLWTYASHFEGLYIYFNDNEVHYEPGPDGMYENDLIKEEIDKSLIDIDESQKMTWNNPGDDFFTYIAVLAEQKTGIDTTPPYTTGHDPAPGATDVPHDTNITVHVKDSGTGVNQSTIVMMVNGVDVTESLIIDGSPADYTVVYPLDNFDYGEIVSVTIDAADLASPPNVMLQDSYSFTIMELKPTTPFVIWGWVNDSLGNTVNNPLVNVTNLNTSEVFTAERNESSNYYQVVTCSEKVSAGNVLHFYASDNGNSTEFNHTVTATEMIYGGFEQNITVKFPYTDLIVTAINAYHDNNPECPPWFNLSNEVDVTVKNVGNADVEASFNVSLSVDGELKGMKAVSGGLGAGNSTTVQFKWTPIGADCLQEPCEFNWSYQDYDLTGAADCDDEVAESNEGNNELTEVETACYNGYMADEPLENVKHGELRGGLIYTTGNGQYISGWGTGPGDSWTFDNYTITIPAGASVELAKLNVYYTWSMTDSTPGVCPYMEVSITNETGTHVLTMEKSYNDVKCTCPGADFVFPFGNYVYNVTDYIKGNYQYQVTVKNVGPAGHEFSFAAPGIVVVYRDENASMIEYWLNEGADVLLAGSTFTASNLYLEECINNATFLGSINESMVVKNATLGVVAAWGEENAEDVLYFNGVEIGYGVYHGHDSPYSKTIDSVSMHVGASNSQVGVNITDVGDYLSASDNMVGAGMGGDGDTMMPANAFLVVEYTEKEEKKDDVAIAEATVKGEIIAGNFTYTHESDDDYEVIEEMVRGKRSLLEHKWTIDVTGGNKVTFYVEANHSVNTEGDDFEFAYSTDGSTYTPMVTVTKIADDDTNQTYELPKDLSGTVYIRVKDTDRTNKNTKLDTIYVDHMFIRSEFGTPSYGVSAAIEPASRTVTPTDSTTYTVTVTNTGDLNASYSVVMSGTAVINETITVSPRNWSTGMLTPGDKNITTVTVSTSNTPEETYTLTATATCVEDASITNAATSELVVSSVANTMHVQNISMWYTTAGPNYKIYTKVKIVDSGDAAVAGARVYLNTTLPDGTNVSSFGDTVDDGTGTVEFKYGPTKKVGNYTSTVTNVAKAGWTYDSGANVDTSKTLIVP